MKVAIFIAIVMASMVAGQQQSSASFINDNNVSNYALTLENLEAAYYQQGLAAFNESAFNAAGFVPGIRAAISVIAAQEANHASTSTSTLGNRGWPAVSPCTYTFTYPDVRTFISTSATIEALGTEAYVGAAVGLTNKDLLNTAAGIASVEARHTAFIRYLLNETPFPDGPFTTAANFSTVTKAVTPFFASCTPVTSNTAYNGSITVSSTTFASYQWASASSFRFPGSNVNLFDAPTEATVYLSSPGLGLNGTIVNSDAKVLNYALISENLEANYYQTFAQAYNASNIQAAYPGSNSSLASAFSTIIASIGSHELVHVSALNSSLNQSKGAPGASFNITPGAPSCTYNWTVLNAGLANPGAVNFSVFLAVAYTSESTGVRAYNGAVDKVTIPTIAQTAAAIHTVEAEHTAFLAQSFQTVLASNAGNGTSSGAFDAAYDYPNAAQPSAVVAIVGPVLSSACTAGIALPSDTRVNFYNDANNNAGAPFSTATGTNANTNTGTATGTNANTNNGGATGTATGTNANTSNGGATGTATGTSNGTSGSASFIASSMMVAAFAASVM